MNFTLNINSDNEGMTEDPDLAVADILVEVARKMRNGFTLGPLYDVNGNAVGSWMLTS